MTKGSIHKVIDWFDESLQTLDVKVPPLQVERMAVIVHQAMTQPGRNYHNLDHIFNFRILQSPILRLTALLHDIVYYQVDGDLSPLLKPVLASDLQESTGKIYIHADSRANPISALVLDVFDFQPGQLLKAYTGMNEFLSALAAACLLSDYLSTEDLLHLLVCIEGTIPFRKPDDDGRSSPQVMEDRLEDINVRYELNLAPERIYQILTDSVRFANLDVGSFADNDPDVYLADTWRLIPETNFPLRSGQIYAITDYRQALQKVDAFMRSLDPRFIYHRYRGVPDDAAFNRLVEKADHNLRLTFEYLGVKLLSIGILEAIASLTGGDAPIVLFMGDVHQQEEDAKRLEHFLPEILLDPVNIPEDQANAFVYRLLDEGRAALPEFDTSNSPLARFLYARLGIGEITIQVERIRRMFAGQLGAEDFLSGMDSETILAIINACAEMVPTRRQSLLEVASRCS